MVDEGATVDRPTGIDCPACESAETRWQYEGDDARDVTARVWFVCDVCGLRRGPYKL
ncbi:MAG: hypothetical protein QN141_13420 [Armatimonadota bacterium]|nr:hypothetical protein [Armatimonadota bacterium]